MKPTVDQDVDVGLSAGDFIPQLCKVSGHPSLVLILRYLLVIPSLVLASATMAMISPVVPSIFRAASLSGPSLRPEMYTLAPFSANALAVTSPSPVPPPVTIHVSHVSLGRWYRYNYRKKLNSPTATHPCTLNKFSILSFWLDFMDWAKDAAERDWLII